MISMVEMGWEPIDVGFRFRWGYHGLLQHVVGIGLVGTYNFLKTEQADGLLMFTSFPLAVDMFYLGENLINPKVGFFVG